MYCPYFQEIRIHGQLHHPNIVEYYGSEIVSCYWFFFFRQSMLIRLNLSIIPIFRLVIDCAYIWNMSNLDHWISLCMNIVGLWQNLWFAILRGIFSLDWLTYIVPRLSTGNSHVDFLEWWLVISHTDYIYLHLMSNLILAKIVSYNHIDK
jgi:hypothetical protein